MTTNEQVITAVLETGKAITERQDRQAKEIGMIQVTVARIEGHMDTLNGTVADTKKTVSELPCEAHTETIVRLEERTKRHGVNWDRVISIGTALFMAIALVWLGLK